MSVEIDCTVHDHCIWAATWQNQRCECVPSEDWDQPGHPPVLIRVFAVRLKKAWVRSYPMSAQRRLWSDWADAQTDLSLRWAHSHFVGFVCRGSFLSSLYDFVWFVVPSQRAFSPTLCHNGLVTTFEPRHDKTNIRPVWSESSLSAWRNLWSLATHWAHCEDSDQTGRMPRLIWVFVGRTLILLVCHAVAHFSTLLRGAGGRRLFLSVAFHGGVFIVFYSVNRKYALQVL